PDTVVVELDGRTVVPGLVDAHSHFYEWGIGEGIGADVAELMLSSGITTTAEFAVGPDLLEVLQGYDDAGLLRVRTSAYLLYDDACGTLQDGWWRAHPPTREPGELLRIGGIKVYSDGGACNVPAASFTYSDGSEGDLYFTVDELAAIVAEVDEAGYQVAVHALGDRAVVTALDAFEQVLVDGANPRHHRIEHNALVPPELRGRYAEVGVVATLFGALPTCFFTNPNNQFTYRTPAEYVEWEWPWRELVELNPDTVFAWHNDYPVLDPGIGRALEGFVTRNAGDCIAPPDVAGHAITLDQALRLMTVGGAYALDRDTEVGSLEVDKFADLLILNDDPYAIAPDGLVGISPLVTVVGGIAEYCAPDVGELCFGA
ncbi:MAG: amidohydrolase family protein, partial [Acidimicrobiales bacterium]|nr:amidohydrolase family protein [Acidimicrobiales bacterium]